MKKLICLLLIPMLCSCAIVRDPLTHEVVFIGWGVIEIEHEADGETYYFKRTISTEETLVELAGFAAAIGAAAILFL